MRRETTTTSNEMTICALYLAAMVLAQGNDQQVMEMRVGKKQDKTSDLPREEDG